MFSAISNGKIIVRQTFLLLLCVYASQQGKSHEEEQYGVKYAERCEVCKYLVIELEGKLFETGKTSGVIETGYGLDPSSRKKKKYVQSELRLVESLEGICDRLLKYNIHKERKDSTRFGKGMSTTFKVLHGLVDKGVKVELGIPEELWDNPSAEITNLKSQCENLVEKHEADIENWYFGHQDKSLTDYLCVERVLNKDETGCLIEAPAIEASEESSKKKGDDFNEGSRPKKTKTTKKEEL